MSKKHLLDLFVSIAGVTLIAFAGFFLSVAIDLFGVNGSVHYVTSDGARRSTTITVNNFTGNSVDMRLSVPMDRIDIQATTGNASARLEIEPQRRAPVLSLTGVGGERPYSITLSGDVIPGESIAIISGTPGFSLTDMNRRGSRINIWEHVPVFIAQLMITIVAAAVLTLRSHRLTERLDQALSGIRKGLEGAEKKNAEISQKFVRLSLYYRTILDNKQKEVEFWRGCMERMLLEAGAARNVCREFLSAVTKRLGLKSVIEPPDDITLVLDALIKEEKKSRLDQIAASCRIPC